MMLRTVAPAAKRSPFLSRWRRSHAAAAASVMALGAILTGCGATVTAPNVVGMRLDAAHRKFEKLELKDFEDKDMLKDRTIFLDHGWVVLKQSPTAGKDVDADATVKLFVAKVDDKKIRDLLPGDAPVIVELDKAAAREKKEKLKKAADEAKKDAEDAAEPSATPSVEPSVAPTATPVDFVRSHLAAYDAGDSATACAQMTPTYRKRSVAQAIAGDTIRKGADCDVMIRQFAKDQEFEDFGYADATLKETANTGTKAAVKISYPADTMYATYTIFLVKVDDRWLAERDDY